MALIGPADQDFLDAGLAGEDAGAERRGLVRRRVADGELQRLELLLHRLQRSAGRP